MQCYCHKNYEIYLLNIKQQTITSKKTQKLADGIIYQEKTVNVMCESIHIGDEYHYVL